MVAVDGLAGFIGVLEGVAENWKAEAGKIGCSLANSSEFQSNPGAGSGCKLLYGIGDHGSAGLGENRLLDDAGASAGPNWACGTAIGKGQVIGENQA